MLIVEILGTEVEEVDQATNAAHNQSVSSTQNSLMEERTSSHAAAGPGDLLFSAASYYLAALHIILSLSCLNKLLESLFTFHVRGEF